MKKRLSILAAAVCVICAAGCANGAAQSQTGTLALGTTTTTTAAQTTTTEATEATEASTSGTATPKHDEDFNIITDEPAATEGDLRAKTRIVYRGVEFAIGDTAADVIAKLGDQSKPSTKSQPCIPGAGELEYFYYDDLYICTSQFGQIIDVGYSVYEYPDSVASTVTGIKLGISEAEVKAILGEPADDYGHYFIYRDGGYSVSVTFDDEGEHANSVMIDDMDLPL